MGVIKKQGILNTIIVYLGIVIGFVSLLVVQPQLLSPSEVGLIRLLLSFGSLLAAVFPLGAPNINVKYLPKFYSPAHKHHGFFGLMLLFPFAGILMGLIALNFAKGWIIGLYAEKSILFVNYFYLVAPLAVLITFIYSFNAYCNAIFKTVFPSVLNDILNRTLLILIIVLYFFKFINLDQFILCFTIIYAVQGCLLLLYIFLKGSPGLFPDWKYIQEKIGLKKIIRYGLILSFTSVSSISIKFLDSVFLGKQSLEAVGIYSVAAFIALIIETPLNSLERIANSKIAHLLTENNTEEIKKIYTTSSRYLMLLGGFLSCMVIVNINDLLLFLPEAYRSGAMVTVIVSIGAFINMATGINYPILVNSSKYIWGSVFLLILLLLSLFGNWLLIDIFEMGIMGAAIAGAVSSSVYNALKYFFIWRNFKMQPFNLVSIKILFVICLSLVLGYAIPSFSPGFISIVVRGTTCSLLFLALTIYLNIVPEFHVYLPSILKKNVR